MLAHLTQDRYLRHSLVGDILEVVLGVGGVTKGDRVAPIQGLRQGHFVALGRVLPVGGYRRQVRALVGEADVRHHRGHDLDRAHAVLEGLDGEVILDGRRACSWVEPDADLMVGDAPGRGRARGPLSAHLLGRAEVGGDGRRFGSRLALEPHCVRDRAVLRRLIGVLPHWLRRGDLDDQQGRAPHRSHLENPQPLRGVLQSVGRKAG